jgi:hypothetical protein
VDSSSTVQSDQRAELKASPHVQGSSVAIGALLSLAVLCAAAAVESPTVSLEHGFHLLYNLDFRGARDQFAEYQQQHADDPMGPMAEAAGLLFSELNRLGVLRAVSSPRTLPFDRDPDPTRIQ